MCFDRLVATDSGHPRRRRGARPARARGDDGNRFAAFEATPDRPTGIGIAILPDVRGLSRFYEELALRFAERGYTAIAFDYFGRTGVGKREDFRVPGARPADDDCRRTGRPGRRDRPAAGGEQRRVHRRVLLRGRQSWLAAAEARPARRDRVLRASGPAQDGTPGPTQRAGELEGPILGLMGGDDAAIPQADVDAFDRALDEAGVEHEIVVYPGAPHSFFDRKQEQFAEASEDAWARVLAFLRKHAVPR